MANIDLNSLISENSVYRIKIIPPADAVHVPANFSIINGYLTNNLSFSGQNQWEGLHQGFQFMKDLSDDVQKGQTVVNQVTGGEGGANSSYSIGGITETIARWQTSQKPSFAFNVMFIRLNPKDDIITPIKILLKGCLPQDDSGKVMGTMKAPYGYKTGFSGTADDSANANATDVGAYEASTTQGTWNVAVGKWFRAPKLILNSVNVNFSQQCTRDGMPLYAEVQLVFETWRLLKAGELNRFFMTGGF